MKEKLNKERNGSLFGRGLYLTPMSVVPVEFFFFFFCCKVVVVSALIRSFYSTILRASVLANRYLVPLNRCMQIDFLMMQIQKETN